MVFSRSANFVHKAKLGWRTENVSGSVGIRRAVMHSFGSQFVAAMDGRKPHSMKQFSVAAEVNRKPVLRRPEHVGLLGIELVSVRQAQLS